MTAEEKLTLLKSYHFPKQLENLLIPQIEESVNGLCAAFIGNSGTNKRKIINDIADFLVKIDKVSSSKVKLLTLAEDDLEFFDDQVYSLVNIEKGVQFDKKFFLDAPFAKKHSLATGFITNKKDGKEIKERGFLNIDKECKASYSSGIEILISQYRDKYIFINCTQKEFDSFINEDSRLSFIFSDVVKFRDITNIEIASIIMENLNKKDIDEAAVKSWVKENRYKMPFENREFALYAANYMNSHDNKMPDSVMRGDSSQKALEKIIGLDSVKQQIEDLKAYLQFKHEAEKNDINLPSQSLHMLFLGNAGCGKTTVARIIAQILYEIGICKENKLVEVSRKDLIGEYQGQTAPKTQAVIDKAMDGVLFIDEAYSLTSSGSDSYGQECITTLIKAMEDNKDRLIVVFAGYTKEMNGFVEANSGIASRIGYSFNFPDYTVSELIEIYRKKMSVFKLTDEHIEKVNALINYYHSIRNAGNGRLVDKIIQNILVRHAKNKKELLVMTEDDVPSLEEMETNFYSNSRLTFPEMLTKDDYLKTAYHELGHAVIAYLLNNDSGIEKITIKPEASGALGYVQYTIRDNNVHKTKQDYLDEVCRLLGGRAAEEICLGKERISGGCSSDIEKATNICSFFSSIGFSDTFELLKADTMYSREEINKLMTNEVKETLNLQYTRALQFISKNRRVIFKVSNMLVKEESLSGERINEIFANEHLIKE